MPHAAPSSNSRLCAFMRKSTAARRLARAAAIVSTTHAASWYSSPALVQPRPARPPPSPRAASCPCASRLWATRPEAASRMAWRRAVVLLQAQHARAREVAPRSRGCCGCRRPARSRSTGPRRRPRSGCRSAPASMADELVLRRGWCPGTRPPARTEALAGSARAPPRLLAAGPPCASRRSSKSRASAALQGLRGSARPRAQREPRDRVSSSSATGSRPEFLRGRDARQERAAAGAASPRGPGARERLAHRRQLVVVVVDHEVARQPRRRGLAAQQRTHRLWKVEIQLVTAGPSEQRLRRAPSSRPPPCW